MLVQRRIYNLFEIVLKKTLLKGSDSLKTERMLLPTGSFSPTDRKHENKNFKIWRFCLKGLTAWQLKECDFLQARLVQRVENIEVKTSNHEFSFKRFDTFGHSAENGLCVSVRAVRAPRTSATLKCWAVHNRDGGYYVMPAQNDLHRLSLARFVPGDIHSWNEPGLMSTGLLFW